MTTYGDTAKFIAEVAVDVDANGFVKGEFFINKTLLSILTRLQFWEIEIHKGNSAAL